MIRLGSLAGYPFEGPRVLAGWTPPPRPAVYAILYKPEPEAKPEPYAVIYVGHADDLSAERFPFQPPAGAVLGPAGRQPLEGSTSAPTRCPAGCRSHREQIARELTRDLPARAATTQQYDPAWKDEWIGEYTAPTAGPLTTGRDPTPLRRV